MLHLLRRHPFAVDAFFSRSLVLTYAFPAEALEPLVAPGLTLDCHGGCGFLAVALVETECLRPAFLPAAFGASFFLSGYRIFTRLAGGANSLRGLQILRSYTNRRRMAAAGNLFTHYQYRRCRATVREGAGEIRYLIRTTGGEADLDVVARPCQTTGHSFGPPFTTQKEARRFAGPLPFTFDYEPETHSLIRVRGVREHWDPQPVVAQVARNTFLEREPFCGAQPALASAFSIRNVPYHWERGSRTPLKTQ